MKEKTLQSLLLDNLFILSEEKTVPFKITDFSAHNAYEIYLLLEGERKIFIGDKIYETRSGDAAFIRKDERHKSEGNTPYRGICLQFTDKYLDQFFTPQFKRRLLKCFEQPIISLPEPELAELLALLQKLQDVPENRCCFFPAVMALFSTAASRRSQPDREIQNLDFRNITAFLEKNYASLKGLEEIARKFGVSKEHLCREFKKQNGMTVITYLNSIRIQEACRLLEKTDLKVEEICARCGFTSTVYFYRVFRKVMQFAPMEYRKLRRNVEAPKEQNREQNCW